jgi:hypothetical protein
VAHCDPEPKPKASERRRRRNKKKSKKRDSFVKETIRGDATLCGFFVVPGCC